MFTGIIECTGRVESLKICRSNTIFWIKSPVWAELKVDQSLSHNGVCLTVEEIKEGKHRVTAIAETLLKSNLGKCIIGDEINIERCLMMNGRLDGHIVQGHVDNVGVCIQKKDLNGSWEFRFQFLKEFGQLIIEKGSIAINGISLTVFNVSMNEFSVAIIPYTYQHTNMKTVVIGSLVNIEFDILGKYLQRMVQVK